MKQSIGAIIVTYNPTLEVLKAQNNSLLNQVDYIIYVDNGSKKNNELVEFFNYVKNQPNQYVISNNDNNGLGYAQNQGIRKVKALNATHVILLDHDSVLFPSCVCNLLDCEIKLKQLGVKVGAVGTTYINEQTGEVYPITKYIGPFIKRILPTNDYVEATFLIASGCLIQILVLEEVGLMNEDLFVDYIDIDWSIRTKSMGYKLFSTPNSKMHHQIGDKRISVFGRKISQHSPIRRYYLIRNSFFMMRNKNVPWGYKLREFVFNFLRIVIFLIVSPERKLYWKYTKKGIIDGANGDFGPLTPIN